MIRCSMRFFLNNLSINHKKTIAIKMWLCYTEIANNYK